MADYNIAFTNAAKRELHSLAGDLRQRVGLAVDQLRETPRPHGVQKLRMGHNLYRLRVGEYRVVYEIDDTKRAVTVTRVRHRRDVYE